MPIPKGQKHSWCQVVIPSTRMSKGQRNNPCRRRPQPCHPHIMIRQPPRSEGLQRIQDNSSVMSMCSGKHPRMLSTLPAAPYVKGGFEDNSEQKRQQTDTRKAVPVDNRSSASFVSACFSSFSCCLLFSESCRFNVKIPTFLHISKKMVLVQVQNVDRCKQKRQKIY